MCWHCPGRRYTKAYFLHVISLGNNNARSLRNYICNLLYYVLINSYTQMKRSSAALVFNIFLAVGFLLFIITGICCYDIKKFEETAVKTSGRVVDLIEKRRSGSRSASYSPVVIYEDDLGSGNAPLA